MVGRSWIRTLVINDPIQSLMGYLAMFGMFAAGATRLRTPPLTGLPPLPLLGLVRAFILRASATTRAQQLCKTFI